MAVCTADIMLQEMTHRLDQLSKQLVNKEEALGRANARNSILENELSRSKHELVSARDDLQREAMRTSLMEQRLAGAQEEAQKLAGQLHSAAGDKHSMDSTLNLVQEELSRAKKDLDNMDRKHDDLKAYYDSVLEVKESSINSLQKLLETHERATREQHLVWEQERAALRDTLESARAAAAHRPPVTTITPPTPTLADTHFRQDQAAATAAAQAAAAASVLQSRELDARLQDMKQQLLASEQEQQVLTKRVAHLESHLREREKLLIKADKRYQELNRQHTKLMSTAEELRLKLDAVTATTAAAAGVAAGARAAEAMFRSLGDAAGGGGGGALKASGSLHTAGTAGGVAGALGQLREAAHLDRKALAAHMELIQEAFQEETRKREKLKMKLGGKLALQSQQATAAQREADQARQQLDVAKRQVLELQSQLEEIRQKQVLQSGKQLSLLQSELQDMQLRHEKSLATLQDAHEAALQLDRAKHAAQLQELESQLNKLSLSSARDVEDRVTSTMLSARLEKLQHELQDKTSSLHNLQHSLYLTRAHWGGLKRLLMRLHQCYKDGVKARVSLEAAAAGDGAAAQAAALAAADLEAAMQVDRLSDGLLSDWDLNSSKPVLDKNIEASLTAGCAVLTQTLEEWQALTKQAQHAAYTLSAESSAQQANDAAVHPLLAVSQLQMKQAQVQAAVSDQVAAAARQSAEELRQAHGAAVKQVEKLTAEVAALKDALHQSRESLQSSDKDRQQLQKALTGSKGEVEAMLAARDQQLEAAKRTITDLQTNVDVLHLRLEHAQANFEQLDKLKAALTSITSSVAVPLLAVHLNSSSAANAAPPQHQQQLVQANADLSKILHTILHGNAVPAPAALPDASDSSDNVRDRIEQAMKDAVSQAAAAAAGVGLVETRMWELERSLEGVQVLHDRMGALQRELDAGRTSTAAVLVKELVALIDAPTTAAHLTKHNTKNSYLPSSSSHPAHHPQPQHPHVQVSKVSADLAAARSTAFGLVGHVKTVEAMVQAVSQALPAWVQLTKAEAKSGFQGELSKVKALAGHQVGSLQEEGATRSADMAAAAATAQHYMTSVERSMQALKQQMNDLYEAGALRHDSALQEQIVAMDSERQAVAAQLSRLLQPFSVTQPTTAPPAASVHTAPEGRPTSSAAAEAGNGPQQYTTGQHQQGLRQGIMAQPAHTPARLLEPVNHLQDAVSNIRGDLAEMQDHNHKLQADRRALMCHLQAIKQRCQTLAATLSSALPLPPDLCRGLEDGVAGFMPSLLLSRPGDDAVRPEPEVEEPADRLLGESLLMLTKLIRDFLTHIDGEASSAAVATVQQQQVVPLQSQVAALQQQLQETQEELQELQEQTASLVSNLEQRLAVSRDETAAAAGQALEEALGAIRREVAEVDRQLKNVRDEAGRAIEGSAEAWAVSSSAAAAAASGAVAALTRTAAELQARLQAQTREKEQTKAEAEEAIRSAATRAEVSQAALTRTKSQLAITQQQLDHAAAGQNALEREATELRRNLRRQQSEHSMAMLNAEISRASDAAASYATGQQDELDFPATTP